MQCGGGAVIHMKPEQMSSSVMDSLTWRPNILHWLTFTFLKTVGESFFSPIHTSSRALTHKKTLNKICSERRNEWKKHNQCKTNMQTFINHKDVPVNLIKILKVMSVFHYFFLQVMTHEKSVPCEEREEAFDCEGVRRRKKLDWSCEITLASAHKW